MVIAAQQRRAHATADRAELLRPTLERAAEEVRQLQLQLPAALPVGRFRD